MLWTAAIGWYLFASGVTLALFGFDKRRAIRGGRRVPERTLHGWELAGGWPGGLVGQHLFRHKRRKGSYQLRFWPIVLAHVAAWGGAAWVHFR